MENNLEIQEMKRTDVAERIDPLRKWEKLTSIGMVESVRLVNEKTSVETRYFISSLENNAQKLAEGIRGHWSIENSLHWVLDVAFKEDNRALLDLWGKMGLRRSPHC